MLWPVAKALLGHYRRYPLQIILVWFGLTLGVSLLVGVTAINQHAKQSYEHGEKLFANPLPYRIRTKHMANKIPQGFYIQLRRDGYHQCVPFDSYRFTTEKGTDVTLLGVDPVALVPVMGHKTLNDIKALKLMQPPYPVMVGQELAAHQGWNDGDIIPLYDGASLGPIVVDKKGAISGTRLIADMSLVRQLRKSSGFSVIACSDMPEEKLERLASSLPKGMMLVRSTRSELESLTDAFHMNLTAMGMLAFLVGLFIFYQAMSLSLIQRQRLVGMLRQTGVDGWHLAQALAIELTGLVTVSWLCGNGLGLLLANKLIPTVSVSLADLYNANVSLSIAWNWEWSFYSLLMAICGAFASCAWPLMRLLKSQPIRLSTRLSLARFAGSEFSLQAFIAGVLAVAALAIYQAPKTQTSGYTIIALMLISAALFTPFVIWKVFNTFSYTLRWVKACWFFADAAASMSYRGVATMAFMIAMAANVGVVTMVDSFRDTTDKWLNQRLAADMYLYPTNSSASIISGWLGQQPEVKEVWWRWEKDVSSNKGTLQVVSTGASESEAESLTVKLGVPNYWYYLHNSKGIMISESMSIKLNLRPGDLVNLSEPLGEGWQVVGVYYDYGNPYNQILMSHNNWLKAFSGTGDVALAVVLNDGAKTEKLTNRLDHVFHLDADRMIDNSAIHRQAMRVFDRTFIIADTLGNITLFIAVCGIFFATVAGENSRQKHTALLRCLGVSSKELVGLGALQLFVFGILSMAIAMPLGLALAKLVIDVVIRQSFGWTMELQIVPMAYAQTALFSMLALILAGALPVIRLIRRSPMKSLRDAL